MHNCGDSSESFETQCFGQPINLVTTAFDEDRMRRSRKNCQRGSDSTTLTTFFFSFFGERGSKYHLKRAFIGLPAKRHLNGMPMMAQR